VRPLRVFIGYDKRTPISYHVLVHSIQRHAISPVEICPLILDQLPVKRRGLTDFTYSRYLVPYLCQYDKYPAIFMDSDILVLDDVHRLLHRLLLDEADIRTSVFLRKCDQRFEWPAVMVFRPDRCRQLTPEFVENKDPHKFEWGDIGSIPDSWHHIPLYDPPMPDAKLIHYTAGTPEFPEIRDLNMPYTVEWLAEYNMMMKPCSWIELMGRSVHAPLILDMMKEKSDQRYEPRPDSSSPPT